MADTKSSNDGPPSYTEATRAPTQPEVTRSEAPTSEQLPLESQNGTPDGIQRARAPLNVTQSNRKITGDFLVFSDDPSSIPPGEAHAFLKTTNASIDAAIWIDNCAWGQAFAVDAKTSNAKISMPVHTLAAGQAVDVHATTSNAQNHVYLPKDFHGTITMKTSNNTSELSPSLQPHSVRLPCCESGATCYEIRGPNGPSHAEIRSSNARIGAGQVGDVEEARAAKGKESSCAVM